MIGPRLLIAAAALLVSVLDASPAAAEALPAPQGLRVSDETAGWQPSPTFHVKWDSPLPSILGTLAASYRVNAPDGTSTDVVDLGPVEEARVHATEGPGRYEVEVWFETGRDVGPVASVPFFFDDTEPGLPRVEATDWFAADVPLTLSVEPPVDSLPPSGIRGYAISVDRKPSGSPCAAVDLCAPSETDLQSEAGIVSLARLPEGVSFAHFVTVSGSGRRSRAKDVPVRYDGQPPDVTLSGVPAGWADGPVRVLATARDRLSGMDAAGEAGPFTALSIDGGVGALTPGPTASALISGDGSHEVEFYARDAAGNVGDGQSGLEEPGSAVVCIDSTPPTVHFTNAQDPAEPERIEAVVADPLSGPAAQRGAISVRLAGSNRPFETIPTSASAGRLVATWNSEAYPTGTYEFRATGYDAAGNSVTSGLRADGARMALANPLKTAAEITLGFEAPPGARRQRRGSRRGHRPVVSGRLTGRAGRPLAGAPVEIVESFPPGAAPASRVTTVLAGEDGAFAAVLAPGPSRRVEARFGGDRLLNHAVSRALELRAPSGVRLRASARTAVVGGAPLLFSGRVDHVGAIVPTKGLEVELQFRLSGSSWSEFRTVETDRSGRFRYRYSFMDDDSRRVRFLFRAHVPGQEGWPYEPAASRPVAVTGR